MIDYNKCKITAVFERDKGMYFALFGMKFALMLYNRSKVANFVE